MFEVSNVYKGPLIALLVGFLLMVNFHPSNGATVFFANDRFTELGIDWCEEEKARYDVLNDWIGQHQFSLEARICSQFV